MDFDFLGQGKTVAQYCVDKLKGKANILIVRGVRGSDPDIQFYNGITEIIKANPGMKIVAEADGEADAATAQSAVSNILPSLSNIDCVITAGGEYGVVQAFEAAGKKVPVVIGANRSEFIKWWIDEKAKNGYETASISSEPSIGSVVVWLAIHVLDGDKVPKAIKLNSILVTNKNVDQYKNILPGTVIAQDYNEQFVVDMLKKYK
jgi:ribose transport system substrate-binding protein